MDSTITGRITDVQGPRPVIDRKTNQPTGATEILLRVEECDGQQYPDSVVLRIYEKDGGVTKTQSAFKDYPGFQGIVQREMIGTFHFHLRGSMGVSQATGKQYAINDSFMLWRVDAPQNNVQTQFAPQQQQQQAFAPQQQQFAQQQPYGQQAFGGGYFQQPQQQYPQGGFPMP